MTNDEKENQCLIWANTTTAYTDCCNYPRYVTPNAAYEFCTLNCPKWRTGCSFDEESYCCVLTCLWDKNEQIMWHIWKYAFYHRLQEDGTLVITSTIDPATKEMKNTSEIHSDKITAAFLLDVNNDTRWQPVVNRSVERCYNDFVGHTDTYQCEVIPRSLYDIADCTYAQNFLQCPVFNYSIPDCEYIMLFFYYNCVDVLLTYN